MLFFHRAAAVNADSVSWVSWMSWMSCMSCNCSAGRFLRAVKPQWSMSYCQFHKNSNSPGQLSSTASQELDMQDMQDTLWPPTGAENAFVKRLKLPAAKRPALWPRPGSHLHSISISSRTSLLYCLPLMPAPEQNNNVLEKQKQKQKKRVL